MRPRTSAFALTGRAAAACGRLFVALSFLTSLLSAAPAAGAQQSGEGLEPDTAPRSVSGRILLATTGTPRPVADVWVVLHRIGSDWAAPMDSVRSRRDGTYFFRYRATGAEGALYFVSADYNGIAYFSPPLRERDVTGEAAELYVFDTTSAPIPVRVLGRHLIVSVPHMDGRREVVEVYELANDTNITRVSGGQAQPTFTAPIPQLAGDFQAGQGDFSPGALRVDGGRIVSHAPIAPGLKQLSFSYTLPSDAFPLGLQIEQPVEVLEVLVEDVAGLATGGGLVEVTPVSVEQRMFRRFLAQQVPAGAVLTVTVPAAGSRTVRSRHVMIVAIATGGLMVVALVAALWLRRSRAPVVTAPAPTPDDADALARAIADLDESFEQRDGVEANEREAYMARREALKRSLAAALAARRGSQ